MRPAQPIVDGPTLGWREWLALPSFGIGAMRAKLDTGARSSALHVEALETFHESGVLKLRFVVRPRRRGHRVVVCSAPVADRRPVVDSGGHRSERWFIHAEIALAEQRFMAELNLADRQPMLFPLLLGRGALAGRFRIDPALSYTWPRPPRRPSTPKGRP